MRAIAMGRIGSLISTLFCFLICGLFSCPLMAQASPPAFLYLLEGKGVPTGTVHVFNVNTSTGGITEAPGSPFNAGLLPNQLIADPTGRFVYVTNQQSQDITAFAADPLTGALTQLPGSPFLIGAQPITAAADPTGRFFYVFATTNVYGSDQELLYEYTIDAITGVLTLTSSSPTTWAFGQGTLISSITFDAAGNYAYLGQIASGVFGAPTLICAVDFGSGTLSVAGSVQPANNGEANQIAVSPTGSFLYSSNSSGNMVNAFVVGPLGGQLTEISGSPYPLPNVPSSLFVHPSGNFLYVANENQIYQTSEQPSQYTGSISAFSIDPVTGLLTQLPGSPFATGINPVSVVVDPTGYFAYSASTLYTGGFTSFAQIMGFSINPSTGVLTAFPAAAFTDSANSNGAQLAISSGLLPTNPVPMISSLNPPSSIATDTPFTLQVNGANFVPGSQVYFGGQFRSTAFVSSTQLNASILASDVDNDGNIVVFVFNPLPGGGASTSVVFTVSALTPTISSTSPTTITATPAIIGFDALGTNFVASSVINFNGTPLTTLYYGPTALFGFTTPGDVAVPGIATISVTTPSNGVPGGGISNSVTITITPPVIPLSVSSMSPTNATAGAPGFTLTVNGSGFVQGSQVSFNLINEPTTFVNSSQITALIPASAIAIAGNPYVIVTNPGGATSVALSFMVSNPTPASGAISPASVSAGSNALTLNVSGTGFTPTSVVLVNGSSRVTIFVSSTVLQAALLPADLQKSGTLNISVVNPPPGGGTTAALAFTVADYNVAVATPNQTTSAGQNTNYNLSLSANNGTLGHAVVFTASGLPPGATGSFMPASVPAGSGSTSVLFTVYIAPHSAVLYRHFSPSKWPDLPILAGIMTAICLLFVLISARSRFVRRSSPLFLTALLITILLCLTACGSLATSPVTQNNSGIPAGTYTIDIAATAGSVRIDRQITLTIM